MTERGFPIKELGLAIQESREAAGLSRASVGRRIGHSAKTVERWEHGETMKARDKLSTTAEALGTTEYALVSRAYELAGRQPPPTPPATGDERLVEMIRELQGGQADPLGRIGQIEDLLTAEQRSGRQQDSPDPKQNNS